MLLYIIGFENSERKTELRKHWKVTYHHSRDQKIIHCSLIKHRIRSNNLIASVIKKILKI